MTSLLMLTFGYRSKVKLSVAVQYLHRILLGPGQGTLLVRDAERYGTFKI